MKRYLIAGLLAWLPLAITVWIVTWLVGTMDGLFLWLLQAAQAVLPESLRPLLQRLTGVPFLSILVLALLMMATGVFVTNIFGQWWLRQWDKLMHRIPIVKSIYSSVKQVSDTLFSSSGNAFREAVLVEYPRDGAWTIAFVTGKPGGEVAEHLDGDWVSVYVPTTPNPTSGFFLMMPRNDVVSLGMSVDQALKYVISMGVVVPSLPGGRPNLAVARNQTG
ncbi:MAG: DUF502 domain-containing protein [Rubrivivax sp.]|nr:DUF502 domain-containing protein [Rubrivivax sp.]